MRTYYTRPCNFLYGNYAKRLIVKKKALPLAGNLNIKDKNSRRSEMIKIRSKTDSGLQKRLSKYNQI